jgi:hypothetical protein
MINNVKKFLSLLILCALGLTVFLAWPGQSQSEKALVIARQSCGLEKSKNEWQFAAGKAPIMVNMDNLTTEKQKTLATLATDNAVLANRAALLDSRWFPLAQAMSKFSTYIDWSSRGLNVGDNWLVTIDGRIQTLFICRAIQEDSNS